jgi:hypothetical protein
VPEAETERMHEESGSETDSALSDEEAGRAGSDGESDSGMVGDEFGDISTEYLHFLEVTQHAFPATSPELMCLEPRSLQAYVVYSGHTGEDVVAIMAMGAGKLLAAILAAFDTEGNWGISLHISPLTSLALEHMKVYNDIWGLGSAIGTCVTRRCGSVAACEGVGVDLSNSLEVWPHGASIPLRGAPFRSLN